MTTVTAAKAPTGVWALRARGFREFWRKFLRRRDGVLGLGPCPRPRIGGVLEPAVGVGDGASVQVLDEVEPGGVGVAHRTNGSSPAAVGRF